MINLFHKHKNHLFLGGTFFLLSACSYELGRPIVERKKIEKIHEQNSVIVSFSSGKTFLSKKEEHEILYLLDTNTAHSDLEKVSVHATLVSNGSDIARKGIPAIKGFLLDAGLKEKQIHVKRDISQENGRHRGNKIKILLDIYRIIAPVCSWKVPLGSAEGSMTYENYGCADARNFYMMIEDPAALWHGTPVGNSDSKRQTEVIRKYNEGKPLDLKSQSTLSSQSSQSSQTSSSSSSQPSSSPSY